MNSPSSHSDLPMKRNLDTAMTDKLRELINQWRALFLAGTRIAALP
jgi:hypothetical protein